jgi:hypothetical protein
MSSLKNQEISHIMEVNNYKLRDTRQRLLPISAFHFLLLIFLLLSYTPADCMEITGPEVKVQDNDIYVTTSLSLEENYLREISNGIKKEFRFYIDIFKVWKIWPDEFVLSKSFSRTMKSDPVKMEYYATSSDGSTSIQKRFKSFESMARWALSINNLKVANMRDLDPGVYFVRVTVESKVRKLPPVLGYFMIFLPENEFKITKDSQYISIGTAK